MEKTLTAFCLLRGNEVHNRTAGVVNRRKIALIVDDGRIFYGAGFLIKSTLRQVARGAVYVFDKPRRAVYEKLKIVHLNFSGCFRQL